MLNEPLTLPCGLVLPNRLVKAAMQELLADSGNHPNDKLVSAYLQWAEGGWGAIITGNVQVDRNHLGAPLDVAVRGSDEVSAYDAVWRRWAAASQRYDTPTIVQLSHPGRQSPAGAGQRGLLAKCLAPSAVPLTLGQGHLACAIRAMVFGTPQAMTGQQIKDVVNRFVNAAQFMAMVGFSGVEIHAAHGYLLAQFLSPEANKRTDDYGGTPAKRAKIVVDIITETRKHVPPSFCVGLKFNSVDFQQASNLEECMVQLQLIVDAGIDFLEISGGSYEDPQFLLRTSEREGFFLDFANEIRKRFPKLLLLVTGGFRSRNGMRTSIQSGACDLVGLARPSVANPRLPKLILDSKIPDEKAKVQLEKAPQSLFVKYSPVKLLGAGAETSYYTSRIHGMGEGLPRKAGEKVE